MFNFLFTIYNLQFTNFGIILMRNAQLWRFLWAEGTNRIVAELAGAGARAAFTTIGVGAKPALAAIGV